MKLDINQILRKLRPLARWLIRYRFIIGLVLVVGLYSWLVLEINVLTRLEPTDEQLTEKLQTIKRPKIDQDVVNKINQLQDNSVQVQTLFKQARDNPFQE